jgi:hypothetical protein
MIEATRGPDDLLTEFNVPSGRTPGSSVRRNRIICRLALVPAVVKGPATPVAPGFLSHPEAAAGLIRTALQETAAMTQVGT